MGGLIRDWNNYYDPVNNVYRPIHMGAMWLQAQQVTGVTMNHKIWINDPPSSSIPACLAFKCIEKQSPLAADLFIKLLREKLMLENINISNIDIVLNIAQKIINISSDKIDPDQFSSDFRSGTGHQLLQQDFEKINRLKIIHFPTLIFIENNNIKCKIEGYHTYNQLIDVIKSDLPELKPSGSKKNITTSNGDI